MFEESDAVQVWINRYQSDKMRQTYLKHLKSYCDFHGKSPNELLDIKKTQRSEPTAEKMLDRFVIEWDRPESVKPTAVAAIRSFYASHYLDLAARAGSQTHYTRVKPIRNPTQEQLRQICLGRNLRDIALINVLSSGGFRQGTLSKLTWGQLSELDSWNGRDPIHIGVMSKDLKGRGSGGYKNVEQHAFLAPHAVDILLKYRNWRESKDETIIDETPLFATVDLHCNPLSERQIRRILERACKDKDYTFSPHDLRRFTQTQLEAARVPLNWIRKMLGKKIRGEEAPYSRPKIEQLRDAYREAVPFLTLAEKKDDSQVWKSQAKQSLEMLSKLGIVPDTEFKRLQEYLQKTNDPDTFYSEVKPIAGEFRHLQEQPANGSHKVIHTEKEMIQRLNEGWELVRELNGDKFLMREIE